MSLSKRDRSKQYPSISLTQSISFCNAMILLQRYFELNRKQLSIIYCILMSCAKDLSGFHSDRSFYVTANWGSQFSSFSQSYFPLTWLTVKSWSLYLSSFLSFSLKFIIFYSCTSLKSCSLCLFQSFYFPFFVFLLKIFYPSQYSEQNQYRAQLGLAFFLIFGFSVSMSLGATEIFEFVFLCNL